MAFSGDEDTDLGRQLAMLKLEPVPHTLQLVGDEAGQNRALCHYLICDLRARVVYRRDRFHRQWNDLNASMKCSGLYNTFVYSFVWLNLPFGPWLSSTWHVEMEQLMEEFLEGCTADNPLLLWLWPRILSDGLGSTVSECIEYVDNASGRAAFLGDLRSAFALRCKGSKTSASRWFSWHSAFSSKAACHHGQVLMYLLLAIRKGWVASLKDLLGTDVSDIERPSATEPEPAPTPPPAPTGAASSSGGPALAAVQAASGDPSGKKADHGRATLAKAKSKLAELRNKSKHTVVLALRLMLDEDVLLSLRQMAIATKPEHDVYTHDTRSCRSITESMRQHALESQGGWTVSIHKSWAVLSDQRSLQWTGIHTRAEELQRLRKLDSQYHLHLQAHACEQLGRLVSNIMSHRACSMLELS
eukprot:105629-Amphidinium_carterae.1